MEIARAAGRGGAEHNGDQACRVVDRASADIHVPVEVAGVCRRRTNRTCAIVTSRSRSADQDEDPTRSYSVRLKVALNVVCDPLPVPMVSATLDPVEVNVV